MFPSIPTINGSIVDFEIQLLFLWKETSIRHALSWSVAYTAVLARAVAR